MVNDLIARVAAGQSLDLSAYLLVQEFATMLDKHDPAAAQELRVRAREIVAALTMNTSHVAVDPKDVALVDELRSIAEKN